MRLLASAIVAGRAHVAGTNGSTPTDPMRWGWRRESFDPRPLGDLVGWVEGDNLYLDPEASFRAVQQFGRDSDQRITCSLQQLKKRMFERGLLASTEQRNDKNRLAVRKVLQGMRRTVLHLRASALFPGVSQVAHEAEDVQDDADAPNPPGDTRVSDAAHDERDEGRRSSASSPRGTLGTPDGAEEASDPDEVGEWPR